MALFRCSSGSGGGGTVEKTTEKMTANTNYTKSVNNGEWMVANENGAGSIAYGYIINGVSTQSATNQYVVVSYSAGVLTVKCTISDRYLQFFKVD